MREEKKWGEKKVRKGDGKKEIADEGELALEKWG